MARINDEIININVGGKKFTTRRSTLAADPKSRLADWFGKPQTRSVPQDKAGNYFLDRDGKTFRYILSYLRFKKDKMLPIFGLPLKPDELAKVIMDADALRLEELRELCTEMLARYQREETNYVGAYVTNAIREYDTMSYNRGKLTTHKDDDAYDPYAAYD